MESKKVPKTIPGIIKIINESNDIDTIIAMENYIGCYYAGPLVFIGIFFNYYIFYILMHFELRYVMKDCVSLLILSLCFIITPYLKLKTKIITHWVSLLFSVLLIYLTVRFYRFMGPTIWTIAFIEIILASARITKTMLNYVAGTTFFIGMYFSIVLSKTPYEFGPLYYILQVILFVLLFIIVLAIHLINHSHYKRINQMYITEVSQREELESMYKEIATTHEELQYQYNELNVKNKQLKINEYRLYHQAHFDIITGLPNRKNIMDKIDYLLNISKNTKMFFYVVFIDLDSFKKINDSMGHHIGDFFIKYASQRLNSSIHKDDFLGRIGGDEFALIINRNLDEKEAYEYIEGIRMNFLKPFIVENNEIRSSASFGIVLFPRDGIEQIELMKNADTAMYKAKELGKNNIQFFKDSMKEELLNKITLENKLKDALYNDEFFLVFQPIYNLKNGKIHGFETLVRWNSPELGLVSPEKFIPAAEEMGLIVPLGEWIMRTACKRFKYIQDKYKLDAVLSINLSVKQLEEENIVQVIQSVLNDTGLDSKYLEIEVTESIFIDSFKDAVLILETLKKMGISISLDDFGTGYSSLSYLRQLPIDVLKIDRSFINDLLQEDKNREIIGSIIDLAHNLGILVIAEGIEEEIQLDYLKKLDCDYIQGFLMSKPVKEEELEKLIIKSIKNELS